ncbi:DNA-binding helix-turn-helix protein [Streptococcus infantis SK1076]|uniref:DNA-binding helix-turn-helix protein n=1 Tax=Streptococcus infantis SK1076 TaxID=1005705 RepID=F5VYT0_9STRE|nr:helix-turn-helix transcriptional regulator [Streptococcus infantis]EGL87694.1 DNA-binding helix-turn-helix protein [Streptococcus infantis SK1076]
MFEAFERIKELAKKRGVNLQKVSEDLGFSTNYLYSLKNKKTPSAEHIAKIAEYFNVSTDYILGRIDNPNLPTESVTTANGRTVDLSNLRERVVLFDGKPLSDEDVDKIAQIIKLSLGVSDIESE